MMARRPMTNGASPTRVPRLSKSRFQAGLQCSRNLWLTCHMRELADATSDSQQAIFDQGHRVGALAREYFPGGVLVEEDHMHSFDALRTTERLLGDNVSCLYEPAFFHDDVLVRTDILFKNPAGGWALVEVKSSTQPKPEHTTDLAIQTYVLRGAGIPVASCHLLHLNSAYVHPGGPYDLGRLFSLADLTAEVDLFLPSIPGVLRDMRNVLAGPLPDVSIGRCCENPYRCGFFGYCHQSLPEFPVTEIPRIDDELLRALLADGHRSILDVPLSYPGLSPLQRTVCDVIQCGEPRFDPAVKNDLSCLHEPIHFLDFETFMCALPLHVGTRPYQPIPFQWSCHTLHAGLEHREFLCTHSGDPRREFAESLIAALAGEGPIVVYTSYENTILTSLAADLPDLSAPITAMQARLFDLAKVVRGGVQHPRFHGSFSLKYVLPALVDDLSYEGLAVPSGEVATIRYGQAAYGDLGEPERLAIFDDLRAYCGTDTLALVRLYEELLQAAES
jgi:hypothetical protein